jgi:hypothetical protein
VLSIQRLDAAGNARANLNFDREGLALDAQLSDPSGLVGRMLGANEDLPVVLHALGQGPLQNWRGTVEAAVADAPSHVAIVVDQNDWALSGTVDPRPLLEARIAKLLPEPLNLDANLTLGEAPLLKRIVCPPGQRGCHLSGVSVWTT